MGDQCHRDGRRGDKDEDGGGRRRAAAALTAQRVLDHALRCVDAVQDRRGQSRRADLTGPGCHQLGGAQQHRAGGEKLSLCRRLGAFGEQPDQGSDDDEPADHEPRGGGQHRGEHGGQDAGRRGGDHRHGHPDLRLDHLGEVVDDTPQQVGPPPSGPAERG